MDSRFNARELSAVKEWREYSDLSLHSMRDHPYHSVELLGASWGTDLTRKLRGTKINARMAWKIAWKYMLEDPITYSKRNSWGPDQKILAKYVKFYLQSLFLKILNIRDMS